MTPTDTTTVPAASTNGAADAPVNKPPAEPSILSKYKTAWITAGSKEATAAQKDPAWKAWKASNRAIEEAEKALDAAREKNYAVSDALAQMYGARSVRVDGVVFDFASRGAKVFLRTKGQKQEIVDV